MWTRVMLWSQKSLTHLIPPWRTVFVTFANPFWYVYASGSSACGSDKTTQKEERKRSRRYNHVALLCVAFVRKDWPGLFPNRDVGSMRAWRSTVSFSRRTIDGRKLLYQCCMSQGMTSLLWAATNHDMSSPRLYLTYCTALGASKTLACFRSSGRKVGRPRKEGTRKP